jgi:hypothetical protein
MPFDAASRTKFTQAIAPVVVTDNTAQVSNILDTQGYDANTWVATMGTLADADATFAVTVDEGDASNLSGSNSVAAADLIGTTSGASFTFADDNKTVKIGYKGTKRYIRVTVTPSNNTGNAPIAAVWVQSQPRTVPETSQKV